jgi:ribosomal protein L11 methyltransferase
MLDVGTGTGILAMYGAMLEACKVMAIDVDPEALRWAQRNIELNGLTGVIELSSLPLEKISDRYSLVVANLVLGTILKLLGDFCRVLGSGGWLLLSGILGDQVKKVEEALARHRFYEDQVLYKKEWACLIFRKNVSGAAG